jgi:hypothetical protein
VPIALAGALGGHLLTCNSQPVAEAVQVASPDSASALKGPVWPKREKVQPTAMRFRSRSRTWRSPSWFAVNAQLPPVARRAVCTALPTTKVWRHSSCRVPSAEPAPASTAVEARICESPHHCRNHERLLPEVRIINMGVRQTETAPAPSLLHVTSCRRARFSDIEDGGLTSSSSMVIRLPLRELNSRMQRSVEAT